MSSLLQKYSVNELLYSQGKLQQQLWAEAEAQRDSIFGKRVFIRGVMELSNYCRQNCDYCGMRRDNRELNRYRLDSEMAFQHLLEFAPQEIKDINFQTGEDVVGVRDLVTPLIKRVRAETSWGVSVCLGTLSEKEYDALKEAGAGFYIIKIESGNSDHFLQIHGPGTLEKRTDVIHYLAKTGWQVSSGFIAGLPGQTEDHLIETLNLLKSLPLRGNSVSPFVPGENTPFSAAPAMKGEASLNAIAVMRLQSPERIIPAVSAFNIVREKGYEAALRAGANLATINITPEQKLEDYQLYTRNRVIMSRERVLHAIESAGLEPAGQSLIKSVDHQKITLS